MWKYIKWFLRGIGLTLFIVGISGIVYGLEIWKEWIELIFGKSDVDIYGYINNDPLKYIFLCTGLFLLFIGSKIFGSKGKQEKADIKIEYDENDNKYYHRVGPEQLHRIYIENMTGRTVENTKVEITDMKPRHPVFTKKFPVLKSFNFHPGKEPVDVVRLLIKNKREMYEFMEYEPTMQSFFSVRDQGHEITTTVSGKNIHPISRKFRFGIQRIDSKSDKFWFKPVD
jgi:hypothetical protein